MWKEIAGSGKSAATWSLECNPAALAWYWGWNRTIKPGKAFCIWGPGDWWRGSDWPRGQSGLDEGENRLDWVNWSPRPRKCAGNLILTTRVKHAWLSDIGRFMVEEKKAVSLSKQLLSGRVMDEGREDRQGDRDPAPMLLALSSHDALIRKRPQSKGLASPQRERYLLLSKWLWACGDHQWAFSFSGQRSRMDEGHEGGSKGWETLSVSKKDVFSPGHH